jgi:HipA-like protein
MRLAVEHVRRMRGGCQSHLMRCDDDSYYVVKFTNNPQGLRILANEMFGTRLAARMGISVPDVDVIDVRGELIKNTPDLSVDYPFSRFPCTAGRQFGSKFPGHPSKVKVYDLGCFDHIDQIQNVKDFLGMLVFDKWTCNVDGRQAILFSSGNSDSYGSALRTFKASMIDQGFCFCGREWDFPDAPRLGLCVKHGVYQSARGIESFEPWLSWLEDSLSLDSLYKEAEGVPVEWLERDQEAWKRLIERLYARRTRVRELIWSSRNAIPGAFVNWTQTQFAMRP